jgi:hypothetical protein
MKTIKKTVLHATLALSSALLTYACDKDGESDVDDACAAGGKCDTPAGQAMACLQREAEVLQSSNRGYTHDLIRWACADVAGVTADSSSNDDRGQEYCEYFALAQIPGGDAIDLGRPIDNQGKVTKLAVCLPGQTGGECRTTLTADQQATLEDDPTAVVGKCVFTSWHADVDKPVPKASNSIYGFKFNKTNFGMKVTFNSNSAAVDLIEKCFPLPEDKRVSVDWTDADDPGQNPFYRGCMGANNLFGTGWRRSDSSICGAINRLAECGCAVPGVTTNTELAHALLPPVGSSKLRRGFRLATWDDPQGLPPGCMYSDTGETGFLVECDITANDLLTNANDPKEFCRATYGQNVVVHIDVPREAITCTPPATNEAMTCGMFPWNIGEENEPAPGGTDPTTDPTDTGDTGDESTGDDTTGGDDTTTGDPTGDPTTDPTADPTGDPTAGGSGNCCTAEAGRMGCENDTIEMCVCTADAFCCETEWDEMCVSTANTSCDAMCS